MAVEVRPIVFEFGRIERQFILQMPLRLLLNLTSRLHYTLIARLAPGSSLNTRPILYQVRFQSNPVYLIRAVRQNYFWYEKLMDFEFGSV